MKISVIIPVKNGAATLEKCLEMLKRQGKNDEVEIIILDSMSTDSSRHIAKRFGAKIIDIAKGTFNHGLTRNLGIQHAKGELIYFTVQDAWFTEDDHLERMAAHFNDSEIQSITGTQGIPHDPDKNPVIWFRRISKPVPDVKYFPEGSFQKLSPRQQLENCQWDNVNAMYRKSALLALSFQKTDFAEDALWARDALRRGWKIIRDPSLVVFHYHHQTFNYVFRIKFMLNYTIWTHFRILPNIPFNVKSFAQNIFTLVKRRHMPFYKKIKWIIHNALGHLAHTFSAIIFRLAYFIGKEKSLHKAYTFFCASVPQGMQDVSNRQVSETSNNVHTF